MLYTYISVTGNESMGICRCQKTTMVYIEYIGAHRAVMIYPMYWIYTKQLYLGHHPHVLAAALRLRPSYRVEAVLLS